MRDWKRSKALSSEGCCIEGGSTSVRVMLKVTHKDDFQRHEWVGCDLSKSIRFSTVYETESDAVCWTTFHLSSMRGSCFKGWRCSVSQRSVSCLYTEHYLALTMPSNGVATVFHHDFPQQRRFQSVQVSSNRSPCS